MTDDRETRLRQRIDQLTNERDQARDKLDACRARNKQLRDRTYMLEKSLALWRLRARQERARR